MNYVKTIMTTESVQEVLLTQEDLINSTIESFISTIGIVNSAIVESSLNQFIEENDIVATAQNIALFSEEDTSIFLEEVADLYADDALSLEDKAGVINWAMDDSTDEEYEIALAQEEEDSKGKKVAKGALAVGAGGAAGAVAAKKAAAASTIGKTIAAKVGVGGKAAAAKVAAGSAGAKAAGAAGAGVIKGASAMGAKGVAAKLASAGALKVGGAAIGGGAALAGYGAYRAAKALKARRDRKKAEANA